MRDYRILRTDAGISIELRTPWRVRMRHWLYAMNDNEFTTLCLALAAFGLALGIRW